MKLAAVASALQSVVQSLTVERSRITTAAEQLETAHAHLQRVLVGADKSRTGHIITWCTQAVRALNEAEEAVGSSARAIIDYAKDALGVQLAAPAAAMRRSAVQPQTLPEAARPAAPRWQAVDSADVPHAIKEAGRRLPKRRPITPGRPPDRTVGLFKGKTIESGGKDKDLADDLVPHKGLAPLNVTYEHVEGKVAAQMRREGINDGVLVLNNMVCGNNEWDKNAPYSCEKVLPSILPPNARLTIWATVDGGRTWWRGTYVGTGERINR